MTRTNLYMSLYGILPLQRKQKGVNRALRGGGKEVTDGLAAKGAAGRGRAASFLGPGKAGSGETKHQADVALQVAKTPIFQGS